MIETPHWVRVEMALAGGHQEIFRLPADSPTLQDLQRALAVPEDNAVVQIPLDDGRAALTVRTTSVIGLTLDPPSVPSPGDDRRAATLMGEPLNVDRFQQQLFQGLGQTPRFHELAATLATGFERRRTERLDRLRQIVEDLGENILVVSTFNSGYLPLFENWVASCDRYGIASRRFTVLFPTDEEADRRARQLGFATYFDGESMGEVPRHAHAIYGNPDFARSMFPKVAAMQDLLELGVDLVRQDMDLVWFADPRAGLNTLARKRGLDLLFMRDLNARFRPLFYNSGFVFVRNNQLTRATFQALYEAMPAILRVRSEQQILNRIVAEYQDHGLRTARLSDRYVDGQLMNQAIFDGQPLPERPIVAHANWTGNVDEKIERLRSCGWWYQGPL